MKKIVSSLLLVTSIISFSGCATIVSSKSQDVTIRSTPPGAEILIDGSVGGTTPMIARLVRKRRHTIQLKQGDETITKATTRGFNCWYLGNLILGGIIGLIVDPITGGMYTVKPEEVHVEFHPDKPKESLPSPALVSNSASKG